MEINFHLGGLEMALSGWCWAAGRSTKSWPEQEEKAKVPAPTWEIENKIRFPAATLRSLDFRGLSCP